MKKQGGILENWFEYQIEDETVVFGESFNDPHHRFYQGQTMRSSVVCFIDRDKGILETYYTIYLLGRENTTQNNVFAKLSLMFGGYETQFGKLGGVMYNKDMSKVVITKKSSTDLH